MSELTEEQILFLKQIASSINGAMRVGFVWEFNMVRILEKMGLVNYHPLPKGASGTSWVTLTTKGKYYIGKSLTGKLPIGETK